MLPRIPWDGVTGKGILVGFLLAGIVGFFANRILWQSGVRPVRAFFRPQIVVHQTKKSPFQVYRGCLAGIIVIITVSIFALCLLAWMTGTLSGYSIFSLLSDLISSIDVPGLLLVGCIVVIITLALRAAGKGGKEEEK